MENNFYLNKSEGKLGEKFFMEYGNKLMVFPVDEAELTCGMNAGRDIVGVNRWHRSIKIEVKSVQNFISRDNDGQCTFGTLPFEVGGNFNKFTGRYGEAWLHEFCRNGKAPDILVYLLYDNFDAPPYASIVFDDWEALEERLNNTMPFDLKNWDFDQSRYEDRHAQTRNGCMVAGKVWHENFNLLSDLATVTMIGDYPQPSEHGEEKQIQEDRIHYLDFLAGYWLDLKTGELAENR